MNHNNLPPSPFGKGTTYGAGGNHVQHPPRISRIVEQEYTEAQVDTPRIARMAGVIATESFVSIADLQQPKVDSYVDRPASRQADLEQAEVQNIIRAAAEAGMSVDQWKASRGRR